MISNINKETLKNIESFQQQKQEEKKIENKIQKNKMIYFRKNCKHLKFKNKKLILNPNSQKRKSFFNFFKRRSVIIKNNSVGLSPKSKMLNKNLGKNKIINYSIARNLINEKFNSDEEFENHKKNNKKLQNEMKINYLNIKVNF